MLCCDQLKIGINALHTLRGEFKSLCLYSAHSRAQSAAESNSRTRPLVSSIHFFVPANPRVL
jgi:hypothetical protein